MVTCANGDAFAVEDGADVVRVGIFENKGDDGGLLFGAPYDSQSGDLLKLFRCVFEQCLFVGGDRVHPDRFQIVDCRTEADDRGDIRGARLEFLGDRGEGRAFKGDSLDHVAAAEKGRHRFEDREPSV